MIPEKRNNTVFLFGAGAMRAWGGPSTQELTEFIRKSGFMCTDNQTRITEHIYQTLVQNGIPDEEINFETIINVIEEMIVYYSPFHWIKQIPPLLKGFFTPTFEEMIFNYSFREDKKGHNYRLDIPIGYEYPFAKPSQHNEHPHQFFLMHLVTCLLTDLTRHIEKYTFKVGKTEEPISDIPINELFTKWIKNISQTSVPRLYTLNYDRVLKVLLKGEGIDCFEGFDYGEKMEHGIAYRANVKRILTDFDSPVHYNLHGSIFWHVEKLDRTLLPNPEIFLKRTPDYMCSHEIPFAQVEKGKTVMVTNIITGYQKAQRSLITPLKQMQAAFDRDCCFADELFVIGYSLGDEHINESIKTALRHNNDLKITFVDPSFNSNNIDFEFHYKISPYRKSGNRSPFTLKPGNIHTFYNGVVMVHTITFDQFLTMQNDPFQKIHLDRESYEPFLQHRNQQWYPGREE